MELNGFKDIISVVDDWFAVIALILLILGSLAFWAVKNATPKLRIIVLFGFMAFLAPILYIKAFESTTNPGPKNPVVGEYGPRPALGCVTVAGLAHLEASQQFLAVRDGPATSNTEVRRLYAGDQVPFFGKFDNWYNIAGPYNNWNGWSHGNYLIPSTECV